MNIGMNRPAGQWISILLLVGGVTTIWVCTFAQRNQLNGWQWFLYGGGAAALLSIFWLIRVGQRSAPDSANAELDALRSELTRRQRRWKKFERHGEKVLRDATIRLDRREQDLARRLIAYHQWVELPASLDLADPAHVDDAHLIELAQKDRQLIELLQHESEALFERIRRNDYSMDGIFQPLRLRDDAYQLIHRVARLYQPDVQHPVLETSVAQVLQAASGACLHFIAVLDRLPLDVKQYNLNSLYRYVRQAVTAYGAYKQVAPFFPYFNAAYRVGRVAMGASPLSAGAWWLGAEFGKRGASSLVTKMINRQAIMLLHDLVRVIGFEVANIYGGDFRHRDANWIYGAELTELICCHPLTPDILSRGLKEISALQLRNEYDRIYLYRLLAERRSAKPEQYRAAVFLTGQERQNVARRLEQFTSALDAGPDTVRLQSWAAAAQQRLHVKVKLADEVEPVSVEQQQRSAASSLAGFLVEVKHFEQDELQDVLSTCLENSGWSAAERQQVIDELVAEPPYFFQQPDIDPDGDLADQYLRDLARLATTYPPRHADIDELFIESGMYLRRSEKACQKVLDEQYERRLVEYFQPVKLSWQVSAEVARAVLSLAGANETPRFLYRDIAIQTSHSHYTRDAVYLFGSDQRVVAFAIANPPILLWEADEKVDVQITGGIFQRRCVLTGGTSPDQPSRQNVLTVYAPAFGSADKYFQPLVSRLQSEQEVQKSSPA